ncbi:MAG: GtrA family protein [Anaerolineae bacterium]|nr:GtrA family protein [Anaerolineae bacterium]
MLSQIKGYIDKNGDEIKRFLKFAVVGTIGAIVDFGTFNLLQSLTSLSVTLSNTISFTVAVISNFIWNRFWTYPDSRSKPISKQVVQFFVVNIAGWAINTSILLLLKDPSTILLTSLGQITALEILSNPATLSTLGKNAAKVVGTGVVMFWNFFVNRYWTYNDVKVVCVSQ